VIDADVVLLDLYDTVADGAWGDLARIVMDEIGVDRETLFRAFEDTRPARSVGAFGSAEGDMAAVIAACGVDPDPAVVGELVKLELEMLPSRARLYEDSLPVVGDLRGHGIRTALISNCSHSTRPIVEHLGLPTLFDGIALSFEVGAAKPDPEIYRAALELAGGASPARAVFVDDQVTYCDGAAALGMRTFLIVRGEAEPMEGKPSATDGHPVIPDLRALLD
jgi:putative hydrolase of the HAD superfamily